MPDYLLNADERVLVRATRAAHEARFPSPAVGDLPSAIIRAEIIRRLMLGRPIIVDDGGAEVVVDVPGPGIRLVNATIEGDLNLDYGCGRDGEELPRLSMEKCYIPGIIKLRSARLRRLCLYDSRVSLVLAHQAYISGQLDIRGVASAGTIEGAQGDRLCRFGLRGAHIEDGIDARRASLVSGPKRPDYVKYAERARYALDLAEAKIGGDVRLFPDFRAIGGVNINGAIVKGSIQAHGAVMTCEEMYTFDASNARIDGRVALDSRRAKNDGDSIRFRGTGEIRFYNTTLAASLHMQGAHVEGSVRADLLKAEGDVVFSAYDGQIDRQPCLHEFYCSGPVEVRATHIGGTLNCRGAVLEQGLDVSNSHVDGHVLFNPYHGLTRSLHIRTVVMGKVQLKGARIAGDVDFDGAHLQNGLDARGARIDGYYRMGFHADFENYNFEANGLVRLNDIIVGCDLDLSGAIFREELLAPHIRVSGKLLMCLPMRGNNLLQRQFVAEKRINLSGAHIQSDFDLSGAILHRGLRFRGGRVDSSLIIDIEGGKPYNIGTDSNPEFVRSSIDLTNAHANVVSDFYEGRLRYSDSFTLKLDGFTYDRFKQSEDAESVTEAEGLRQKIILKKEISRGMLRDWKHWLTLQYENGKPDKRSFSPGPYNTLFTVLKRNGQLAEADKVLVEKLKIENSFKSLPEQIVLFFHHWLFNFGLSPIWATGWYLIFIVFVAWSVHESNRPHHVSYVVSAAPQRLVAARLGMRAWSDFPIEVDLPTALFVRPQAEPSGLIQLPSDTNLQTSDFILVEKPVAGTYLTNVPCGQRINSVLYALDMIVPVIDLGQKSKCDFATDNAFWAAFKGITTVIGWIMTSLVVLTWSGALRRRTEPTV